MYYYGYQGGYGYNSPCCGGYMYPQYGANQSTGYGSAIILVLFIFLSQLVPKRDHFLLIIATPYAVEAGKSLADSLSDPTSKMFKLNQLVDKGLEKMLKELSEPKE